MNRFHNSCLHHHLLAAGEYRTYYSILEDPAKSRRSIYTIHDPFLHFWFGFIKRYDAYFEQGRTDELFDMFLGNFDTFLSFSFERIVKEFLIRNKDILPFSFDRMGRQWGTIKGAAKGKNSYEIDLLIMNTDMSKVMLVECKWRDLRKEESREIIQGLQEKKDYLDLKEGTEVCYGLCARTINGKAALQKEGIFVLDLEDIGKVLDKYQ